MNSDARDEILLEFIGECEEALQRVSQNLSLIEKGELVSQSVDELYRDIHTMKGSAQLLGLHNIGMVAHAMEACLDPIRKHSIRPSQRLLDAQYECLNLIESLILKLKQNEDSSAGDESINKALPRLIEAACRQFGNDYQVTKEANVLFDDAQVILAQLTKIKAQVQSPVAEVAMKKSGTPEEVEKKDNSSENNQQTSAVDGNTDSSIRVQVGLLDTLMNLVGEMVLVRNQVLQHSSRSEDLEFLNLSQRLDIVTSELQDQVMRTRMQPIGNILSKFQRVIRDLSKELGKRIDLTVQGKDTELDKTLLESIKDPLTHIVRNSCDHGIESPQDRLKSGKPETGHILIRAFHEGGQVIVEISDDGKGIPRKRVVQKAIEKGVLTQESAEKLTDRDKLNLIFHAGLSTAAQVSAVSGRGVGMDVVRTNIEKIGGSVEVESTEGRGTTIRLRIPLTLAIVPAMLVKCNNNAYAIPQIKLVELVRVEQDSQEGQSQRVRLVQGKPVYELRGRLLPLIDLRSVLKTSQGEPESNLLSQPTVNIVVLNAEGEVFGLVVDEVMDTADIVVKPLSKFLKSLEVFSAATILGSGMVALILDPMGLVKVTNLSLEKRNTESDFQSTTVTNDHVNSDIQEFLLFRTLEDGKYAIPLCMVNRLEEFKGKEVEFSGKQQVMRYRESILPLLNISHALNFSNDKEKVMDSLPTIVVQKSGKSYGIVVEEILDVCSIDKSIDDTVKDRFGLLGNVIFGQEVINVIDALSILEKEFGKTPGAAIAGQVDSMDTTTRREKLKVLYAEDVGFFRRQVSKILSDNGFDVTAAEDGARALEILKEKGNGYFSLVLSDIEMPKMNGMQLARAIREIPENKDLPLVALTTRFRESDIEEGMSAGFDFYLEKLNPDFLLERLSTLLAAKAASKGTKKGSAA